MALTPQSNDTFLREVDDALRQDELKSFWTRYGRVLLALVVIGLVAFGGWLWWNHYQTQQAQAVGEEYSKLLDRLENQPRTVKPAELTPLLDASQPGYRAVGLLSKAGLAQEQGDAKGAIAQYKAIAADSALAQPYRDLALVRQTALEFDSLKPQDVVNRLKPLAAEGSPWFGSAGEMVAVAYMKMGKLDLAGPLFAAIGQDDGVPRTIRIRATQMASAMGVEIDTIKKVQSGNEDGAGE